MRSSILVTALVFALVVSPIQSRGQTNKPALFSRHTTNAQNLKVFDALWEKVNSKYYDADFNGVDWREVRNNYRPRAEKAETKQELLKILRLMLAELKTSHLYVWQTVSERDLEKQLQRNFDRKHDSLRIGYPFTFKKIGESLVVTSVQPKSALEWDKVKVGWVLEAVDNVNTNGNWTLPADLTVGRKTSFSFRDINNKRYEQVLTVEWLAEKPIRESKVITGNILYLKFDGFKFGTNDWLLNALKTLGVDDSVIVDLRSNHGGLVDEVQQCLGRFFARDIEFGSFIERTGKTKAKKIEGQKMRAFAGKLVVLVDETSSSGAEIFAQLIQENQRGTIIGSITSGQVLNGIEFGLPEDFRTSIAFRDYFSPRGFRIEGSGVRPDIQVDQTIDDIVSGRDIALDRAVLELQKP